MLCVKSFGSTYLSQKSKFSNTKIIIEERLGCSNFIQDIYYLYVPAKFEENRTINMRPVEWIYTHVFKNKNLNGRPKCAYRGQERCYFYVPRS